MFFKRVTQTNKRYDKALQLLFPYILFRHKAPLQKTKTEIMNKNHNISIPAVVRFSNISASAKIFFGEIQYEILYTGFCRRKLDYFAELLNSTVGTVRVWLYELIDNFFIRIEKVGKENHIIIL